MPAQQSICLGKRRKKSVLWGNDERKGLNILKHMEDERIFSKKGPGLARDVLMRISIEALASVGSDQRIYQLAVASMSLSPSTARGLIINTL
jgi:hypothetical protein